MTLGGALLVIAFLLGRESARGPSSAAVNLPAPPVLSGELGESVDGSEHGQERRWPEWADLEEWGGSEPVKLEAGVVRVEERADGTVLLSNRNASTEPGAKPSPEPTSEEREVSSYFSQMDVIRSHSGAGDPNSFAMGLLKAGMGGSTAGFGQLIADTQRMEEEAKSVTPPPSCQQYHGATLQTLAESRQVLEEMKAAFALRDFNRLTGIAQRAGTLQAKAEALRQLRDQIESAARR